MACCSPWGCKKSDMTERLKQQTRCLLLPLVLAQPPHLDFCKASGSRWNELSHSRSFRGCLCSLLIMSTLALHHLTLAFPPALLRASCPHGSPCCSQSDLLCDCPKCTTPCQLSPMLTHFSLRCYFLCLSLSPQSQAPGPNSCDFSLFSSFIRTAVLSERLSVISQPKDDAPYCPLVTGSHFFSS